MSDEEIQVLQNKLKFYEAFHAKAWMSGFISTDITYDIELKAQKLSGFNQEGELVTWDTSEIEEF